MIKTCIVLDLDGTLVYSSEKKKSETAKNICFSDVHGDKINLWVHKRPWCDEFISKCEKYYSIGIWSMGQPNYVNEVVSLLNFKPAFIYNWCNCDRELGRIFKRLDNVPFNGDIIMIDDNPNLLEICNRAKVIQVPEWKPKFKDDNILEDLILRLL